MAYDMLGEGLIDEGEALLRVDANRLEELFKRRVDATGATPIATGLNASPGAATGAVVFTADEAQARGQAGERVILVRRETTPDDYHGMIAAQGILTSSGGTNSHAAVVARGEGIPAVCGADAIKLRVADGEFNADGTTVREGDTITIDGFTGHVFVGELPLQESLLERARQGDAEAREEPLWRSFERLMVIADDRRVLKVRANADTPDQSTNARERGAEGIGLCRTEHMFLGEERVLAVRQMIFAETAEQEQVAYDILLPLQRGDFVGIFTAMSGLPVTVRLLDPPLHEFLPDQVELAVEVALGNANGDDVAEQERVLQKVNELHEMNPMLGLRGVRLGIVKPGLYAMQVRAIVEAAVEAKRAGADPKVEIMIPLVATAPELAQMRAELEPVATEILEREGVTLDHLEWGTMIELPRAAVTAGEIAETAEFFSFGTNDLTQTAFGFSRDDIGKFVGMYEERKLVPANPFVTIDRPGVGSLMRTAAEQGKQANPSLHLGICGEHGGDPASVVFCHELGLDYVSCSPVPSRDGTPRRRAGRGRPGRGRVEVAAKDVTGVTERSGPRPRSAQPSSHLPRAGGGRMQALRLARGPCPSPSRLALGHLVAAGARRWPVTCPTGSHDHSQQGIPPRPKRSRELNDVVRAPVQQSRQQRPLVVATRRLGPVRRRAPTSSTTPYLARNIGFNVRNHINAAHRDGALYPGIGAYNCRLIDGSTSWSVHSWGAAVDTNWQRNPRLQDHWNGRGFDGENHGTYIPDVWRGGFPGHRFFWGLNWDSAPDPMHFQYVTDY